MPGYPNRARENLLLDKLKHQKEDSTMFILTYTTVDNIRKRREFATIGVAAAWAQHWVGRNPEFGSTYAMSGDGIGKIEVNRGCEIRKLFEFDAAPWVEGSDADDGDRRAEVLQAAKSGVLEYLKSTRGAQFYGSSARIVDTKFGFVVINDKDDRLEFTTLEY